MQKINKHIRWDTLMYRKIEKKLLPHFPFILNLVDCPKPQTIYLEPTNNCNLNCIMCYARQRKTSYMDYSTFTKLIDEISEWKVPRLALQFGGESITHPNFEDMLKHVAEKYQGEFGWASNGMLLNEKIADLIIECNVSWFVISLDGVGEINDRIRVGAKYDTIKKNFHYLLSKRGSKSKPYIYISTTYQGQDLGDFVEYWKQYVDEIRVKPCLSQDCKPVSAALKPLKIGDKVLEPVFKREKFCSMPFREMAVFADGRVAPCCADALCTNQMGDITENSLHQIWRNDKYRKIRRLCLKNQPDPSTLCNTCTMWKCDYTLQVFKSVK